MNRQCYVNSRSVWSPCDNPATKCIIVEDDTHRNVRPLTIWLCEYHYSMPEVRGLLETLWDKVEY
jgi:hypothetical protein